VKIGQSVAELSRFFRDFQDGGCRRLGFSKIGNFKSVTCGGGAICITVLNFIKIRQTVA